MIEILNHRFISGRDTVGVVLIKNNTGRIKCYIGVARGFFDEQFDIDYIRDWGAKLTYQEAKALFPEDKFTEEEYD